MEEQYAEILKIQRYTVNDGPGIRTTVFFKGCPLHCAWCHNPDSISGKRQLSLSENICTHCGICVKACPNGLHQVKDGQHSVRFEECTFCGKCVEACPQSALSILGEKLTAEQIISTIERDKAYYIESGGGITVSGGEPMLQYDFVEKLFDRAHAIGINTALDTSGFCKPELFARALGHTDYLLLDLKIMDPQLHRQYTGVDNRIIHENFRHAVQAGANIFIRHIVVPGINDSQEEHRMLAELLLSSKFQGRLELLPYHSMGRGKYSAIGKRYTLDDVKPPRPEQMQPIKEWFQSQGINTRIN